jgi:hypothetical protein
MSTTSTTKVQGAQEQEVTTSKEQVQQRRIEQQEAINKALDETKNNIKRTTSKEQQMKQGKISHIMLKL